MFIKFINVTCGKVDQVPGLFYVATEFFDISFVPLIPLRSFVIPYGKSRHGDSGGRVPIELSVKSIIFAWVRLGIAVFGLFGAAIAAGALERAIRPLAGRQRYWLIFAAFTVHAVLMLILFFASYRFSRARPRRAIELAQRIGIPPEHIPGYFAVAPTLPTTGEAPVPIIKDK